MTLILIGRKHIYFFSWTDLIWCSSWSFCEDLNSDWSQAYFVFFMNRFNMVFKFIKVQIKSPSWNCPNFLSVEVRIPYLECWNVTCLLLFYPGIADSIRWLVCHTFCIVVQTFPRANIGFWIETAYNFLTHFITIMGYVLDRSNFVCPN